MKFTYKMLFQILSGIAVIVLITVILGQCALAKVRPFELSEQEDLLQWYEESSLRENHPFLTEPVGPIENAKTAKKVAEDVWLQIYGETAKDQKPYEVYYDEENSVWCVCGTASIFESETTDGVVMILLQAETGEILAVGQSK